jgi:tetratricopeptide (TPR) repeat protein
MSQLADVVIRWLDPGPDPVVDGLTRRARRLIRAQRWEEAAANAQNALRHAQQSADTASLAHALVHQARVSQALRQGPRARESYRQAVTYFHLLARENDEAVTLALLGDAEQDERRLQEAMACFQQAQALIETLYARQQNAGNLNLATQYALRSRRLKRRIDWLAAQVSRVGAPASALIEWVPILDGGARLDGDLRQHIEGAVLASQLLIDNRPYELRPVAARAGGHFRLVPGATYYALPVREDDWAGPETRRGDYVLLRRDHNPEAGTLAATWFRDRGLIFGEYSGEESALRFTPLHGRPGLEAGPDAVVGYVEAILRPVA